ADYYSGRGRYGGRSGSRGGAMNRSDPMNQEVELLRELVSIASPSTQEQAASTYLVNAMRARGYDEAFVDAAGNAVGIWGRGERDRVARAHRYGARPYPSASGGRSVVWPWQR